MLKEKSEAIMFEKCVSRVFSGGVRGNVWSGSSPSPSPRTGAACAEGDHLVIEGECMIDDDTAKLFFRGTRPTHAQRACCDVSHMTCSNALHWHVL